MTTTLPSWYAENGIDLSKYPIDEVLRQAISVDEEESRTACTLLKSMCGSGRSEAGIFLSGLLRHHPENYPRLAQIADALGGYRTPETVEAFAEELRRVRGSSLTRRYLGKMIDVLERFPPNIVEAKILSLSTDPNVGARFRQRLKSLVQDQSCD